jgi:hypothetical protein
LTSLTLTGKDAWQGCGFCFLRVAALFSSLPEPGFLVPGFSSVFFVGDKGDAKRAAINLGKIAPCSKAERRNFDLSLISLGEAITAVGGSF